MQISPHRQSLPGKKVGHFKNKTPHIEIVTKAVFYWSIISGAKMEFGKNSIVGF